MNFVGNAPVGREDVGRGNCVGHGFLGGEIERDQVRGSGKRIG